jgi:hypothetical protein
MLVLTQYHIACLILKIVRAIDLANFTYDSQAFSSTKRSERKK